MKKNKNILTLSASLLIFLPLQSNVTKQEPTAQQIEEAIIHALNDSQKNFPPHISKNQQESYEQTDTEKALTATIIAQKNDQNQTLKKTNLVALDNATNLLQTNIEEALKVLTPAEIEILTTVISEIVDTAIAEIQTLTNHEITIQDGTKILQDCINNLRQGTQFTLNGTTYTIIASKTKK